MRKDGYFNSDLFRLVQKNMGGLRNDEGLIANKESPPVNASLAIVPDGLFPIYIYRIEYII